MADDAGASGLQGSIERVRSSARWILAAFGALGAALAIGAQFSNLGKLEGNGRDWAIVGVGLAFLGLGLAIAAGGAVLAPRGQALNVLADREKRERNWKPGGSLFRFRHPALKLLDQRPSLLTPFTSVDDLSSARAHALSEFSSAYKSWRKKPDDAALRQKAKTAADEVNSIEPVVWQVLSWADFAVVRAIYSRALTFGVFPGVVLAAVGMTIFALEIPDVPPAAPTPAEVRIENDLHGVDLHGATLHGADLTGANLDSTNLAGTDLSKVTLDKADLTGADLTKANLEGASLANAKVERVTWKATTCPDGKVSDDVGGSCAAHLIPIAP